MRYLTYWRGRSNLNLSQFILMIPQVPWLLTETKTVQYRNTTNTSIFSPGQINLNKCRQHFRRRRDKTNHNSQLMSGVNRAEETKISQVRPCGSGVYKLRASVWWWWFIGPIIIIWRNVDLWQNGLCRFSAGANVANSRQPQTARRSNRCNNIQHISSGGQIFY